MTLSAEFYHVNATTALLWLLQNLPHSLILFLFSLGCLCVVTVCMYMCWQVVVLNSRFCRLLMQTFFQQVVVRIVKSIIRAFTPGSSVQPHRPRPTRASTSELAIRNSATPRESSLSLPQALALHPHEWSSLEAVPPHSPALEDSLPLTPTPHHSSSRRSRRHPRIHLPDPTLEDKRSL